MSGVPSPDCSAGTVVVVRHGETEWNATRRFQGWAAVGLNERGRRQARALGEYLASAYDVDRVLASDLRRTRETTALLREAGVRPEPTFERAWRERDLGVCQGLTYGDVHGAHPEFDPANGVVALESRPERGESFVDLYHRVRDGWTGLRERVNGETVLLVTHGGPLHVLHGLVNDEDLRTAFDNHSHGNCAVSEFRIGGEESGDADVIEVACKNETAWAERAENAD